MSIFDRFRKKSIVKETDIKSKDEITITVPPSKIYRFSKDNIQLDIIIELEQLLDKTKRTMPPLPQETVLPVPDKVRDLINAGFENTELVQNFRVQQKACKDKYMKELEAWNITYDVKKECTDALKCLIEARKVYGRDTLLLPYDQFYKLCEKHGLVCGPFESYRGDIPDDKLQEILKLKDIVTFGVPIIGLRYVKKFSSDIRLDGRVYAEGVRAIRDKLLKFPFVRETRVKNWERILGGAGKGRTTFMTFIDGTKTKSCFCDITCGEYLRFFITAPEQMMGEGMNVTVDSITKGDPFICAATEYGILIFIRWGEEAIDEIIQRFEAFSKNLDELGDKLGL